MLRRNTARPWFPRRERPNRRLGVPGGRPDGYELWQNRPFSLASGGSSWYDGGSRFDKLVNVGSDSNEGVTCDAIHDRWWPLSPS